MGTYAAQAEKRPNPSGLLTAASVGQEKRRLFSGPPTFLSAPARQARNMPTGTGNIVTSSVWTFGLAMGKA